LLARGGYLGIEKVGTGGRGRKRDGGKVMRSVRHEVLGH
jgi:hypothetical protein